MRDPFAVYRLSQIGFICAVWADFESIFAHAIWAMLGLDMKTGMIVTGGMDMRPRANMAVRLARHLHAPRELREALEQARQKIDDDLLQRRNLVVHGIHNDMDDEATVFHMHRGKRHEQRVTNEEFHQIGEDIRLAAAELRVHVRAYCRSPSIARKMRSTADEADSSSGS